MNNLYRVGDRVWSPICGWGEITEVDSEYILVKTGRYLYYEFRPDGSSYAGGPPVLFFEEIELPKPVRPWKPYPGEWVAVSNDGPWVIRKFVKMSGDEYTVELPSGGHGDWKYCQSLDSFNGR